MRFSALVTVVALAASAFAAPIAMKRASGSFPAVAYATGQISGGTAGTAEAQANAICTAPFAGVDLKSVSADSLKNLAIFRSAAEAAETDFNTAVDAASGAAKVALQNGKIKNKVLKLTCLKMVNQIKQAQGSDAAAAIADVTEKLAANVKTDKAQAGKASTAIANSAAAAKSEKARKT